MMEGKKNNFEFKNEICYFFWALIFLCISIPDQFSNFPLYEPEH